MHPHIRRVALGRLEIAFSGHDFIAGAVLDEVTHQDRDVSACTGRLDVRFGATAEPGTGAVEIDRYVVGGEVVCVRDPVLPHSMRWAGPHLEVAVRSAPGWWKVPPLGAAVRLADQAYNDAAGRLAKRFYYTVFDQAVQIAQVPLGQSWIHASAVTDGDRTALFMAWGGVGKTTALLKLLETGAWRFLADDLAVLVETGTVHRSPQRMQVFARNVRGQHALRDGLLAGRPWLDRWHWAARRHLLGDRGVRRRVHAEDLFGAAAGAVSGQVTDAVHLHRTTSPGFTLTPSTPHELAQLSASVLQVELEPLNRWLATVHGAAPMAGWPTTDGMIRDSAAIIEAGLAKAAARCLVVGVPAWSGPDDLLRFLRTNVLA